MFCDVSGFTKLCEAMAAKGPSGDEYLARALNSYFEQLVRVLASQGGDVFKYAGDAILVVWPPSEEDLTTIARRAAQCALEVDEKLQAVPMGDGIVLNVKVGVGVGEICIVHVGGVKNRMEYLAVGDPLVQAFHAEGHATKSEVVLHPEVWKLVAEHFDARMSDDGFAFPSHCKTPLRKASVALHSQTRNIDSVVLDKVISYIPKAVVPFVAHKEEKWAAELRRICVLFVNLGLPESELNNAKSDDKSLQLVHRVLSAVQVAVYKFEGSLNKFLMDDKGSTLVAVFGLAPLAHDDDATRAIRSALHIIDALTALGRKPSIGITTGQAFCGIVGTRGSREYSVLGDTVNLSARLMQHATKKAGGGIIIDGATEEAARADIRLQDLGDITVKGKSEQIRIFKPFEDAFTHAFMHGDVVLSSKYGHSSLGIDGLLTRGRYQDDIQRVLEMLQERFFIQDPSQLKQLGPKEWNEIPASVRHFLREGARCQQCARGADADAADAKAVELAAAGVAKQLSAFGKSKRNSILQIGSVKKAAGSRWQPSLGTVGPGIAEDPVAEGSSAVSSGSSGGEVAADPHLTLKDKLIIFAMSNSYLYVPNCRNPWTDSRTASLPPFMPKKAEAATAAGAAASADGTDDSTGVIADFNISKRIRIILPYDLGILTLSCPPTLRLKDMNVRVWSLIKTLKLIPGVANARSYSYATQPAGVKLTNSNVLMESLFSPSATPTSRPEPYTFLLLSMVRNDDELADSVCIGRGLLIDRLHQLQAHGRGHTILLEGAVGSGKSFILETSFTDSLNNIYATKAQPQASPVSSASVPQTSKPPPSAVANLRVWCDLVTQMVDAHLIVELGLERPPPSVRPVVTAQQRGTFITQALKAYRAPSDDPPELTNTPAVMLKHRWYLDDVIDVEFEAGVVQAASPEAAAIPLSVTEEAKRNTCIMEIFLIVIMHVAKYEFRAGQRRGGNMVLIIDNAMHCAPHSWQLSRMVSQHVSNVLLIIATRPFDQRHSPPFQSLEAVPAGSNVSSSRASWEALKARARVGTGVNRLATHMIMQPRSPAVIERVACVVFGRQIKTFPAFLRDLVVEVASGNPLAAKELCIILVDHEFVFIHDDEVKQSHKLEYHKVPIPIPHMLQVTVQSQTDRLSHPQKMLLKIGAVIAVNGGECVAPDGTKCFSSSLLKHVYPITTPDRVNLDHEMTKLVELDFFRIVEVPPEMRKKFSEASATAYAFSQVFVRACTLKRMVGSQTAQLEARAAAHVPAIKAKINSVSGDSGDAAGGAAAAGSGSGGSAGKAKKDPGSTPRQKHSDSYGYTPSSGHGVDVDAHALREVVGNSDGPKVHASSVYEGYINKRGGKNGAWKRRYCILWPDRLEYYKSKGDKKPAGQIPIYPDTVIRREEYKEHTFGIVPEPVEGEREYIMKIKPAYLACHWVELLKEQIAVQTSQVLSGMLRRKHERSLSADSDSDAE